MKQSTIIEKVFKDFLQWNAARINFFSGLYHCFSQG
jgi:hypothetical protein